MRGTFERGFLAVVLALAGFFGAIYLLQEMPDLLDREVVFIALLFFPLLIYVLISGVVSEVSGPGGWGAKFHAVAEKPVDLTTNVLPLQFVTQGEVWQITEQLKRLKPRTPVAIILKVDLGGASVPAASLGLQQGVARGFDPFDLAAYFKAFLEFDPELTVIYVDRKGKFLASSDALSVKQLEDADFYLSRYVDAVNDFDPTEIRKIVPLTSVSLGKDRSNASALKAMNEQNVRSIVAVDEFKRPVGVVRREVLLALMMESLVT